ncbi:MAG: hypothetical protein IKH02_00480 [Prevotella sp.]|nr:hypothetical protein [Prevotella sp.]
MDEQQNSIGDTRSNEEGMGYVDVDSDNVFVGIFRWFSPRNIDLPYNSKPTKVTVAVDNDAEDVFEIEKSLFYMLQAFALKLFFAYLAYFVFVGLIFGGLTSMIYNSIDSYEGYQTAGILVAILGVIVLVVSIIVCFMIFLYIFRPYWSHIHVRLRELHIRHWRNVYRAIKDVK